MINLALANTDYVYNGSFTLPKPTTSEGQYHHSCQDQRTLTSCDA